MWNIAARFLELLATRYQIGALHGSEDISVLLYSLVRREKPKVVVELGTGLGVSTVWIASAMKENGFGVIYTFDNGSHFEKESVKDFLRDLSGPIEPLAKIAQEGTYVEFVTALFELCDVQEHITLVNDEIDIDSIENIRSAVGYELIDMIFSDYRHSPAVVEKIVAKFLPLMSETSSIFIDSASSHIPSFLTLEQLVQQLNDQKLPKRLRLSMTDEEQAAARKVLETTNFKLMHLMEKLDRRQNSTSWIRLEPADLIPPVSTFFH